MQLSVLEAIEIFLIMPTIHRKKEERKRKKERRKKERKKEKFLLNTEQSAKNDHKIPLNIAKHHKMVHTAFAHCERNNLEYIKKT